MTLIKRVIHAHNPFTRKGVKNEHVIMAAAYGTGTFLAHSPIATALIGSAYLSVAFLASAHESVESEGE